MGRLPLLLCLVLLGYGSITIVQWTVVGAWMPVTVSVSSHPVVSPVSEVPVVLSQEIVADVAPEPPSRKRTWMSDFGVSVAVNVASLPSPHVAVEPNDDIVSRRIVDHVSGRRRGLLDRVRAERQMVNADGAASERCHVSRVRVRARDVEDGSRKSGVQPLARGLGDLERTELLLVRVDALDQAVGLDVDARRFAGRSESDSCSRTGRGTREVLERKAGRVGTLRNGVVTYRHVGAVVSVAGAVAPGTVAVVVQRVGVGVPGHGLAAGRTRDAARGVVHEVAARDGRVAS